MFPVPLLSTIICCRSIGWLLLVAPVALVVVVAPVAPVVSSVVACGSSIGGFVLVHGSRLLYLLMLRYLSFVAPVSVVRGSSGGSWLSLMAPVLSNVTSCGSKLSLVAPVAAMVVFPPVALTGNHLVFW